MSTQAQYASTPKIGVGVVTTGDTSRTAPTNVVDIFTAGANGSRIDRINLAGIGTTLASTIRLFLVPGNQGAPIQSITYSGTTATVTTTEAHGLATGVLYTSQNAFPSTYNVTNTAITVLTGTTFTYTMSATPTTNALTMGTYSTTAASPTFDLWQEVPVTAVTPSGTVQVYTADLAPATQPQRMPLILPAGWSLRASVNDTQTSSGVNVVAVGGDF
jgi:hypothetical protein